MERLRKVVVKIEVETNQRDQSTTLEWGDDESLADFQKRVTEAIETLTEL